MAPYLYLKFENSWKPGRAQVRARGLGHFSALPSSDTSPSPWPRENKSELKEKLPPVIRETLLSWKFWDCHVLGKLRVRYCLFHWATERAKRGWTGSTHLFKKYQQQQQLWRRLWFVQQTNAGSACAAPDFSELLCFTTWHKRVFLEGGWWIPQALASPRPGIQEVRLRTLDKLLKWLHFRKFLNLLFHQQEESVQQTGLGRGNISCLILQLL